MLMGDHTTWTWTPEEKADWELAQDVIRMVWVECSTRMDKAISGEEKVALRSLALRLAAEYNLLERTDHVTVHRILKEYPRVFKMVRWGRIQEVT